MSPSHAAECKRMTSMQPYRNLAGNSGVAAFEILRAGIKVRFKNGATYLYDEHTPGKVHVDEMKRLALSGRGLSTYVSQFGGEYAERLA
jgi:hypothetical protein